MKCCICDRVYGEIFNYFYNNHLHMNKCNANLQTDTYVDFA